MSYLFFDLAKRHLSVQLVYFLGACAVRLSAAPKDKRHVIITISDMGCGMSAQEVERIFNPEYMTKEKGLGLGLPLAHKIIRGHGGEISVSSS
jgi:signal transduction histidine kinase